MASQQPMKCKLCPCTAFEANMFQPSKCRTCLHQHDAKNSSPSPLSSSPATSATSPSSSPKPPPVPTAAKPPIPASKGSSSPPSLSSPLSSSPQTTAAEPIPTTQPQKKKGEKKDKQKKKEEKRKQKKEEKKQKKEKRGSGIYSAFKTKAKRNSRSDIVIGGPVAGSFEHQGHAGWDKEKGGFQMSSLPPEMEKMLKGINSAMEALGAGGLTEEEAKLILSGNTTSLKQLALQLQQQLPAGGGTGGGAGRGRGRGRGHPSPKGSKPLPPPPTGSPTQSQEPSPRSPDSPSSPKPPPPSENSATKNALLQAQQRETKLVQLQKSLQDANEALTKELESLRLQRNQLESDNLTLSNRIKALTNSGSTANAIEKDLRGQIEKLKLSLQQEQKRADEQAKLTHQYEESKKKWQAENEALKRDNNQKTLELEKLKSQFGQESGGLKETVGKLTDEVKELKSKLAVETERAENIHNANRSLEVEVASLKLKLESATTAAASGSSELSGAQSKLQDELAAFQLRLNKELEETRKQADIEKNQIKEKLQQQLDGANKKLEEERKAKQALEQEKVEFASKLREAEAKLRDVSTSTKEEQESFQEQITALKSQNEKLEQELNALKLLETNTGESKDQETIHQLKEQIRILEREMREQKQKITQQDRVIKEQQQALEVSTSANLVDACTDGISVSPTPPTAPTAPPVPSAPEAPSPPPVMSLPAGGNSSLLDSIRNPGITLKKVEKQQVQKSELDDLDDGNVLNLIAKALIARRHAIKEEGNEEEGDWDDEPY